ncbi:THO complex subunit 4B [Linum perenne]
MEEEGWRMPMRLDEEDDGGSWVPDFLFGKFIGSTAARASFRRNCFLKELFSEVGDVKQYGIHHDSSGRSKELFYFSSYGTAEVVFFRRTDALSAVKRYNNVQLDGKPMKIEIVGSNIATPVVPLVNGNFGNLNGPCAAVRAVELDPTGCGVTVAPSFVDGYA